MRFAVAAWIALATHVAAAIGSLLVLQHGSPVGPAPASRESYVAAHLGFWRLGWVFWTLASLSLVLLLFALDKRAGWLAVAGLPFDLPSQLLLAIPSWPHEGIAYFGTGVVANAIYTAAFAWAAVAAAPRTRTRDGSREKRVVTALTLPTWLAYAALPAIVGGIAVSAASLVMHPTLLWWSMAILSAGMIAWLALAGIWASREGR